MKWEQWEEGRTQVGELEEPELRFWWGCWQTRGRGGKDEGRSGELPQPACYHNRDLAGTPSWLHVAFMLNRRCCFFLFILRENDRRVRVFWAPAPDGGMGLESPCRTGELCSNRLVHARNKKSGDSRWIKTLPKDAWWRFASDLVSNQTHKLNSVNDRKKTPFSRSTEMVRRKVKYIYEG